MTMKLVPNWRKARKWLSIQIPAVNIAFLGTWAVLPPKFQDALPVWAVVAIAVALLALGMVGRLIQQEKP
jgi:protein-S-isoprenylcysteine O-methyltransferase Ste14